MASSKYLKTNSPPPKKKAWFVAFGDFHDANTSIMALQQQFNR